MLSEAFRRKHWRSNWHRFYLAEFVLVYGLALALTFSQPLKGFCYFGLMYLFVYVTSRYVDYVTHVATEVHSQNSFANVCLDSRYNSLFWNFGFHIAHHLQPRAHWTALPSIHGQLALDLDQRATATTMNFFGVFIPPTFHWHRPG